MSLKSKRISFLHRFFRFSRAVSSLPPPRQEARRLEEQAQREKEAGRETRTPRVSQGGRFFWGCIYIYASKRTFKCHSESSQIMSKAERGEPCKYGFLKGSFKDRSCNHLKHVGLSTPKEGGTTYLQGNVQVYNVRIPVLKGNTRSKVCLGREASYFAQVNPGNSAWLSKWWGFATSSWTRKVV